MAAPEVATTLAAVLRPLAHHESSPFGSSSRFLPNIAVRLSSAGPPASSFDAGLAAVPDDSGLSPCESTRAADGNDSTGENRGSNTAGRLLPLELLVRPPVRLCLGMPPLVFLLTVVLIPAARLARSGTKKPQQLWRSLLRFRAPPLELPRPATCLDAAFRSSVFGDVSGRRPAPTQTSEPEVELVSSASSACPGGPRLLLEPTAKNSGCGRAQRSATVTEAAAAVAAQSRTPAVAAAAPAAAAAAGVARATATPVFMARLLFSAAHR